MFCGEQLVLYETSRTASCALKHTITVVPDCIIKMSLRDKFVWPVAVGGTSFPTFVPLICYILQASETSEAFALMHRFSTVAITVLLACDD